MGAGQGGERRGVGAGQGGVRAGCGGRSGRCESGVWEQAQCTGVGVRGRQWRRVSVEKIRRVDMGGERYSFLLAF